MSKFASAIKEEIARVARKEVRALTTSTRKLVTKHRSEIAALKKTIADQDRKIARLTATLAKGAPQSAAADRETTRPEGVHEGFRYSVRSLRSHRKRQKLSAAEYAALLDVSMQTVYNWEHGKARPRASQMPKVIELRNLGRREALARLDEIGAVPEEPAPRKAAKKKAKKAPGRKAAKTTKKKRTTVARKKTTRKRVAKKVGSRKPRG